jgi:DNA polymerase-3 subunit delta
VDKQMISLLCAPHPTRDPFDFTNAILDANTKKAFAIFAEMKAKKEKPELILGSISRVICDLAKIKIYTSAGYSQADISALTKMHAYRVGLYAKQSQHRSNAQLKRAVRLCAKTDAKMKRAVTDPYLLLERLIVELSVPVTQGR